MKDLKFASTFVGSNLFHWLYSSLWRCKPFQRQNRYGCRICRRPLI